MTRDNSQPTILIAGLGSVGRRHLQNLRALGYSNFLLYRSHKGALPDAEAAEVDEWPVFTDLAEALRRGPDVAVICNPTALHVPVAIAAAEAGCHLFIEKPLSHTLSGCAELQALVRQNRLVTMVGCQFRFHPLLIKLRGQIRDGRLGEVIAARSEWGEYLPGWHPWEDHRRGYSARKDLGGGAILTLIHPLDYLYWLFGEVKKVRASMRSIPSLQTETGDDLAEITLEFKSGVIGQVHLDYIQSPPVHILTVLGDQGRATLLFEAGTLRWEGRDGSSQLESAPDGFERNTMFENEMRHFLECIKRRTPACVPLEDGIAALEIAVRAKRDALEGI